MQLLGVLPNLESPLKVAETGFKNQAALSGVSAPVALFAAAGSKTRQQGQYIAAFFMLVERRVSLVSPPDSCVLGVQLFLQYFHLCAVNMGNQCLKKISDADRDGYKQHNQM